VTRPAHQAPPLARAIEAAGGRAILFPAIEIGEMDDLASFYGVVDELEEFDLAVFVSPNAAERAIDLILARRQLPPGLRLAAIGSGGVRALAARTEKRFAVESRWLLRRRQADGLCFAERLLTTEEHTR